MLPNTLPNNTKYLSKYSTELPVNLLNTTKHATILQDGKILLYL